jgi:glucosamine kinase
MIIVVDSGSTKADWAVADNSPSHQLFSTMGFNPVYHKEEVIYQEAAKVFEQVVATEKVKAVHYYGAGCWDQEKKSVVAKALQRVFSSAEVQVYHDLLGAARAACGKQAGIACILGTGSNSCLFDGDQILDNVTNLGYFIGDEGSGAHLGKELVKAFFYRELPREILVEFQKIYTGGKAEILDNVYGKTTPNVYLAKFTRFLSDHRSHPFIQKIIYKCFEEFIDRHVRKYKSHLSLPVNFIGSIAYHFKDFLIAILEERSMIVGDFVRKPIDSLVHFHTGEHQ